ncbi:Zinc finger BED domain-containing protein 4 [Frankliniella fusca]|uniref:Zinc finger BED domain-containing protein 4 n=1 Tax=Frankliniella fusca TaxID=407009 RepID=A0AAE1GW56_9NEOP|nr:Zinc finger BED domain-containing protein 4 [Frankliniella fusca]
MCHFNIQKDDEDKIVSSTCKFCKQKWIYYNATKMRDHLVKQCKDVPKEVKASVSPSSNQEILDEEDEIRTLEASSEPATSTAVARATMVMSNLPFSTFSTPEWKSFFQAIRPSFELPSEWNLRHTLLNELYETVNKSVEEKIEKAEHLSILTDGYSNIRNEGIMAFIITTPEPIFLNMALPGTNKEDHEYLSGELLKVITKVGPEKVTALCTDNASNMRKAWEKIEEKYPHITCYGCSPHVLNLLSKDILKLESIKDVVKNSTKIVKAIKRSHVPLAVFTKKQKTAHGSHAVALKLPGKTRWSGTQDMLTSLYKNKRELKETVIDSKVKFRDTSIKETVLNEDFWEMVNSTRKLLKPIVSAIIYLEGDERTVADVPTVLARMQKEVSEVLEEWPLCAMDVVDNIEQLVKSRIDFGLRDVHLAANYLHPVYQGRVLPDHMKLRATKYITKMARQMELNVGEVLANAIEFQQKEGLWNDSEIFQASEHLKPHSWWKGFCCTQAVAPIAIRILQQPSSAAPVERLWSNFGLVHTKLRNRLKNSTTKKLVTVRWNSLLSRRNSASNDNKKRRLRETSEFYNSTGYPLLQTELNFNNESEEENEETDNSSIDSDLEEEEQEEESLSDSASVCDIPSDSSF